ncbi:GNAT family N-acetyltransferase [Ancylomarina salipaludis]|uniref:GNAT family N-acetyltransferase n=1 Tax=Ancylomarina salipaludis TaxID=2501299 RepID=A0A4Q1JJA9_9BACT|nr:GNAT family N-acetyltransferase [Ancylomarina salipaludis]RXQ88473.1 GNAT family N-acetyltransferase [Ancylomarina salipaludis]
MEIRQANIDDALNIKYLKTQVWLHTYATQGVCNEYTEYLDANFTVENCLKKIEDKSKFCLVAEQNGFLIAYCELDFTAISPENKQNIAEMTILYVSEHFHGQGIGKALIIEAEKRLASLGRYTYWLSCYIENKNAIEFYKYLGFKSSSSIFFTMNDNRYENLVFQKEIRMKIQ